MHGVAVEQARRRRTASGKRSEGAGGSRFPGEKRTFTCSLHEKKRPHDQGRHHGRIVKFSIASVISARYAGCAPSVRHAIGTVKCPVRKKYDLLRLLRLRVCQLKPQGPITLGEAKAAKSTPRPGFWSFYSRDRLAAKLLVSLPSAARRRYPDLVPH